MVRVSASLPFLAALQWAAGIGMGLVVLRSARRYGASGAAPRALCRLGIGLFVVGVVALIAGPAASLSTRPLEARVDALVARLPVLLQLSQIAWIALIVAVAWTAALSVVTRKRAAETELRRRAQRVRAHRDRTSEPPSL